MVADIQDAAEDGVVLGVLCVVVLGREEDEVPEEMYVLVEDGGWGGFVLALGEDGADV